MTTADIDIVRPDGIRIRTARHDDAAGFIAAHVRSIREVCSKDYSADQITAWSGRDFREDLWRGTMDRDTVLTVAKDDGTVAGFCHWVPPDDTNMVEIQGFYLVPEVTGCGIGKACVAQVVRDAVGRGAAGLKVVSTRTAVPFYRACGFADAGDVRTYSFGGIHVECYLMVMIPLTEKAAG